MRIVENEALTAYFEGTHESGLRLCRCEEGLALQYGDMKLVGDFSQMRKRIRPDNLGREMLVKAARFKKFEGTPVAVDATAGLGEDSFLLAAAGFEVHLFEYNPVIAALLEDALLRASEDPTLAPIAARMHLRLGDSIAEMQRMGAGELEIHPDMILLDPMFPTRQKSGLIQKKFQILQRLERPCGEETELLEAAIAAHPKKVVIKRPAKGPVLGDRKPSYEIRGSVVRYDCIVL